MTTSPMITRFAPSPTGYLHLGHLYSATKAYEAAHDAGGVFILRIEDIDTTRSKPEYISAIYEDLAWAGLTWQEPVRIQSEHFDDYGRALTTLKEKNLLYPCFCSRKDIQKEIISSQSAPHGVDGPLYPGTCRALGHGEREEKIQSGEEHCWRLDSTKSKAHLQQKKNWPLSWNDESKGENMVDIHDFGDVVLARKDTPTSYHLSVTVDDALQGITHVIRGKDLFDATHIHRFLQALLNLPTPKYTHHKLLRDKDGKRFAKRDKARTIKSMRESGVTREGLLKQIMD